MEISKMEDLITDLGTMMVLSEKSNNDIRSCLSILQYLKAKSTRITLGQVQSSSAGAKDMQQGLFTVWESVFQIKLSKKGQGASSASKVNQKTSLSGPLSQVLQTVQSYGDYERLTNGVFENYAKVRSTDSPIAPVVKALNWFVFQDLISAHIKTSQNYSLYGYLPWAFVQWHILFASIQKPKLVYPSTAYDVASRIQRNRQVLDFLFSGMSPKLQSYQHRGNLLLDVAPMLVVLITPNVRPVSIQLYTQKEKNELGRVVSVMADYNVNYSQMRTPEGHYNFLLDPNIEELVCFSENPRENITTYTVRQLLSKEVECEKIRRSAAKSSSHGGDSNENKSTTPAELPTKEKAKTPAGLPNHLQKLTPKAIKKKVVEVQAKDFFGRIVEKSLASEKSKAKTDEIVKSDIWFHFKEGYNNAVRKNVYLSDLL
uniref:Uncharacterized protein n=1 Tax=Lygus hesperus TaxID=30085 RepID=A0A0K8SZZ0_LYGHE